MFVPSAVSESFRMACTFINVRSLTSVSCPNFLLCNVFILASFYFHFSYSQLVCFFFFLPCSILPYFKQTYFVVHSLLPGPWQNLFGSSIPQHRMTTAHTGTGMQAFTQVLTNSHTYKSQCYAFTLLFSAVVKPHKW